MCMEVKNIEEIKQRIAAAGESFIDVHRHLSLSLSPSLV